MIVAIFMGVSLALIIGALMVIISRSPVHSALWLIFSFCCIAVLYIMAGAEFLAAVQIFVYAGGIMILYIFVIMLVSWKELAKQKPFHVQWVPAFMLGVLILMEIIAVFMLSDLKINYDIYSPDKVQALGGNIKVIGVKLLSDYVLPFEIASVVIIVAMLGAIVLGKQVITVKDKQEEEKRKF